MFVNQGIWQTLVHGGFTVVALLLMSLWSWYLIVERWFKFRRAQEGSDRLSGRVCKLVRAGQLHEARDLAQRELGAVARLLHVGLAHPSKDKQVVGEALERRSAEEVSLLEQGLGTLGTLGSVAPYVGLFGTVIGIMRAFRALAATGQEAGAATVSAGIAEALVATAFGLAVAVPAVVFYNAFARRLGELDTRLSLASSELLEALFDRSSRKAESDAQD